MTCDIDPGTDQDEFRFAGATGEVVVIQSSRLSGNSWTCLELFRPDGTTLEPKSCHISRRFNTTLDQTGQYRIRVTEHGANGILPYSLLVDRVGPASPVATPLDPGGSAGGIISTLGEIDSLAFQGEAGDVISLVGLDTSATNAWLRVELMDPDGALVRVGQVQTQTTINQTLDQSGVYTVLLSEHWNDHSDMTYRLDYSCSGVCPALVLNHRYIDSASLEDMGGSVAPEVAVLRQNRNTKVSTLLVEDGETKASIKSIGVIGKEFEPLGVAAVGDQSGDLISELAVLGLHLKTGDIWVWVVDPILGAVQSRNKFFNSRFTPLAVTRIEDMSGVLDRICLFPISWSLFIQYSVYRRSIGAINGIISSSEYLCVWRIPCSVCVANEYITFNA